MKTRKKLAYVTGSRAEYGIVKRLLKEFKLDNDIEFDLIVTGMHLDSRYGNTYKVIEADGFEIKEKIKLQLENVNNKAVIHSMSECLDKFGRFFQENRYDAVIVLGDRYEIFSVATAAAMHNMPLIHIHGGEKTLGNYDEFIRHSISKMARLHLTSTEEYRKRVIQLGENPKNVLNIGSLGAENNMTLQIPSKEELFNSLSIVNEKFFLVVFHPETFNLNHIENQIDTLLKALNYFSEQFNFIFIGSNSDTHSDKVVSKIKLFSQQDEKRKYFPSVKPEDYLALMKYSEGIIGNSSSGLIEAPSCGIGTVNIGDRQKGRVRGDSVIDIPLDEKAIISAIHQLLSNEFKAKIKNTVNPYYKKDSVQRAYFEIKKFIETYHPDYKDFYDIDFVI